MCTTINVPVEVDGSAKGPNGWCGIERVNVGYDHPTHAPGEHAILVDFVDLNDLRQRVAGELDRDSPRAVALAILSAVDRADAYEDVTGSPDGDRSATTLRSSQASNP